MKIIYIFSVFTALLNTLAAQSFEGKLIYEVNFDIKTQKFGEIEIGEKQIIEKLKEEGKFFDQLSITLRKGNYVIEDNSSKESKRIYLSEPNKIYSMEKDFDHVSIMDAKKYTGLDIGLDDPKIELSDTIKIVNGIECNLVKLSWGKLAEELYWFNPEYAIIDPLYFENHNYEYLNEVLKLTRSYPLEIEKKISNFVSTRSSIIEIINMEIDENTYQLPPMKKANKKFNEMMLKITGAEVMKIKN